MGVGVGAVVLYGSGGEHVRIQEGERKGEGGPTTEATQTGNVFGSTEKAGTKYTAVGLPI